MACSVPTRRTVVDVANKNMLAGYAVLGKTWQDIGLLSNWILGRGAQLIPANSAATTALTTKAEHIYYYRVRPRYQALERVWLIGTRSTSATTPTKVQIRASETPLSGTADSPQATFRRERTMIHEWRETLTAQAATATTLELGIYPIDQNITVEHISCFEMPRFNLVEGTTNDLGTDVSKAIVGQPILNGSLGGAITAMSSATTTGRRVSILQWAVPAKVSGSWSTAFAWSTASGTYSNVLDLGAPVVIRKATRGTTTGKVTTFVLAWVTAGTGTVKYTSSANGDSDEVNITATTPTWTEITNCVGKSEVITDADGVTGGIDIMNVAGKVTGGTLYIASISAWED